MTSRGRRAAAAVAAVLALGVAASCGADPAPSSPPGLVLDTMAGAGLGSAPVGGCGSVAFEDLQLEADPNTNPPVWLRAPSTDAKMHVRWPPGFTARFEPDLVIYDGRGRAVATEGDVLTDVAGLPERGGRPPTILSFNGTDYPCE